MQTEGKMLTKDCRPAVRMQTEGKMRTKDCRPGVECRLRVKCGLKTVDQG